MSITNNIIIGLVGGVVTVGVAYFILAKLADFKWWWLAVLFGAQFLAVVLTAYVVEQKFGCGVKAVATSSKQVADWSNLSKAVDLAPTAAAKSPLSAEGGVNPADWQDLLKQLDQMSKEPAVPEKPAAAAALVCPAVMPMSVPPASKASSPAFDFSIIASAVSTPASVTAAVSPAPAATKFVPAPIVPSLPQTQTASVTQGIDFASLFR